MQPSPSQPEASHRMRWVMAAGLVAAVAGVYWNSLDVPFIFDDFPAVVRNTTIRDLGNLGAVLQPPLEGAGVTGRPLVNLSFAVNYALHGLSVRGYHVMNLALHALAALTLWGVLRRSLRLCSGQALRLNAGLPLVGRPALDGEEVRRPAPTLHIDVEILAFSVALLWAVHPLLTESVVCIAQRNEVLVGVFYFLTFYGFVRGVGSDEQSCSGALRAPGPAQTAVIDRRYRFSERLWLVVAVASCWLGMATKEVMATAPLLVLLFDRTFVAGSWAEAWRRRKYFHAAMMAGWLLLAWLMAQTDQRAGIVGFGLGMSSWDYLVTQSHALMLYLKLSFWPHPLVVDYGPVTYRLAQVWPEFTAVVALGLATLWALWRHPKVGYLGAWFFVILAPSSSFVPLTTQTIAEHRMYLPLVAVVTAALLGLEHLSRRGRPWLVGALAVVLGVVTVRRNADYLDELHFWQDSIAKQPANARLQASLGYYHLRQKQWPEAIAAYEKAISLRDNFADAHSDLGSLLLEVGRIPEAVSHGRLAAELKPADPAIRFNHGVALERAGDLPAAIREWEEALRLRPGLGAAHRKLGAVALSAGRIAAAADHFAQAVAADATDVEAWSGRGQALTQENRLPEAVECFNTALKLRPDLAELHYNLGNVWLQMNRLAEAAAAYMEARRRQPEFAAASHNLALTLVRQGRPAEAIPHYEQVVRLLPGSARVRHNFALALAQAGRVPEAIAQEEAALGLDPGLTAAREQLARLRGR